MRPVKDEKAVGQLLQRMVQIKLLGGNVPASQLSGSFKYDILLLNII